jgi:hypothetical protein
MCHGFTGNMHEYGLFVNAAKKFCENGFTVLRFDFRGANESEGEFVDMTISGEVSDLKKAIDFMLKQNIDKNKIGILGLSLGAVVSVLGWDDRIKSLILWSPASNSKKVFTKAFGKQIIKKIEEKGFFDLQKPSKHGWRTQTSFKVGKNFWEESKKTNIVNNIKSVKCSVLIIQGTSDEVIDYHDSEELFKNANKPKELKLIESADHTFQDSKHEKQVIDFSLDWFNKWLK